MKRLICFIIATICLISLCAYSQSADIKAVDRWDCSVECAQKSVNTYVITYSDEEIISHTGFLSFNNQNDFVAVCVLINPLSGGLENMGNVALESVVDYPGSLDLHEVTPIEQIEEKHEQEEFVITRLHDKTKDGMWTCDGYTYKFRLQITGKMNPEATNTTYIVLSNTKEISLVQTWKASGFSSNTEDYFEPSDAVIVRYKCFS